MSDEIKRYFQPGEKNLMMIYILYLSGVVVPLFPTIGVIMAYLNQEVEEQIYSTHYKFAIRTFFIAFISMALANFVPFILSTVIYGIISLWFIIRVVTGLKYLVEGRSYPDPFTLLI